MTIGQTRTTTKKEQSAEIEQAVERFLANGGEIRREGIREGKQIDLTWRNYAATAMEDVVNEAN